jgi:radical SAM superfamily enzyme YgiQ (UPF0313 family)
MILLIRPTLSINEKRPSIPLGLLNLASYLEVHNIQSKILDLDFTWRKYNNWDNVLKIFYNSINSLKYKYFGISVNDANLPEGLYWAKLIKTLNTKNKIIFGGPGVTFNDELILKNYQNLIDVIVRGEGEKTIKELLNAYETNSSLQNVTGITFYSENVKRTVDRQLIENLDDLPLPNYSHLKLSECLTLKNLE